MQDLGVREKLYVANLEDHTEREPLASLFENRGCGELLWGERGDYTGIGEAG